MANAGSIGPVSSSRLTKILQEKAEQLKRRREAAELSIRNADEHLRLLASLQITLAEAAQREAAVKDAVRRSDWDAAESSARSFVQYIEQAAAPAFEVRRNDISERLGRLGRAGVPTPPEVLELLAESPHLLKEGKWGAAVERLLAVDEAVRAAESDYVRNVEQQLRLLTEWAGSPRATTEALTKATQVLPDAIRSGKFGEALDALSERIRNSIPEANARRDSARAAGEALVAIAREMGAGWTPLDEALKRDGATAPLQWPSTVAGIEEASRLVALDLRDRVATAVNSMRATVEPLRDQGIDPSKTLAELDEVLAKLPVVSPAEIPALLRAARDATEEPVVAVVASYLDDVRPRLVEARRLGRDLSEVFAAMNRAREALRLRIYSEAIAAAQEAVDRVAQLTGDFEGARLEVESLETVIGQLSSTRFPVSQYEGQLARATTLLQNAELDPARAVLLETAQAVGREAFGFFQGQLVRLRADVETARQIGCLPPDADANVTEASARLESAQFGTAAALMAEVEAHLRAEAGPYVARRIEEIESGLGDVGDEALINPVRRSLADADVNLRVKEDFQSSIESLRRAERDFSSVVAARASSLVEALDGERRILEAMDGTGDEIQRQIDEVQQIFNMGDFVKASKASQEIRTRAQQQQLIASEEAISHAKLSLVELGTLGLDTATLKVPFDQAQESLRAGEYLKAYRLARDTHASAEKLRGQARLILDMLSEATQEWQNLRKAGVALEQYRDQIAAAKASYQSVDFDGARATLSGLAMVLGSERRRLDTARMLTEADLLLEDARRLGIPTERILDRIRSAQAMTEKMDFENAHRVAVEAHRDLIALLRPVLEESFRSLESDLETAARAGLDLEKVRAALTEGRKRLSLPVPTGVAETLEGARTILYESKGFLEHAERTRKRALDVLATAELVRVDSKPYRARLERLEAMMAQRNYGKAVELASDVERELTQAMHQAVSRTLAGFHGMVSSVKRGGAETTLAENMLEQARAALNDGRPLEALQLAARSESELERVELQLKVAEGSLATIEDRVQRFTSTGVVSPEGHRLVKEARQMFERRAFADSLSRTFDAAEVLAEAHELFTRSRDAIQLGERAIEEAKASHADVVEAEQALAMAREQFGRGEYGAVSKSARQAGEQARWAIERLFGGTVAELRLMLDGSRPFLTPTEYSPLATALDEAEAALKTRDLKGTHTRLDRLRQSTAEALDRNLARRLETLKTVPAAAAGTAADAARRSGAIKRIEEARGQGDLARAFDALTEAEGELKGRQRDELARRVAEMQERLLWGEKLGVDTTPIMESFSNVKRELEAGKTEGVTAALHRYGEQLGQLLSKRLEARIRDLNTEIAFADDALHVVLGPIPESMKSVDSQRAAGRVFDAVRTLLATEEELGRRKALHRELVNVHYLVDAALTRAADHHIDTTKARTLLDESIRARATDYAVALEKARAALALLQGQLREAEQAVAAPPPVPPATFWPFRRPTAPPPKARAP